MMSRWMVVVTGPDMVNDIRRATDDQVSFREAVAEVRSNHVDPALMLIYRFLFADSPI